MDEQHTQEQQDTEPKAALAGSVGPIINSGGDQEIGAPTPPYEGHQTAGPGQTGPGYGKTEGHLAFDSDQVGQQYAGREISEEERHGMSATDPEPGPVHGVGEGRSTQYGNDDFEKIGTQGESQRPVGKASSDQDTGVGAQENIDPSSPQMTRGDQGG